MSPETREDRVPAIASAVLRTFAGFASRRGSTGSLLILTYHRVIASRDALLPDEPDASEFAALIDCICGTFNVLPLGEALALRSEGRLPARTVCITFDDGYANNAEVALPILTQRRVRATFYVATGYLNGGRMWNDSVIEAVRRASRLDLDDLGLGNHAFATVVERRAAIDAILGALKYREFEERMAAATEIARRAGLSADSDLMMSDDQVRQLVAAGMEVGAHTVSHPILARIDRAAATREIEESKRHLEHITGGSVVSFAYPNGRPGKDYGREHVDIVRAAGYASAVTTAWGCVTSDAQPLELPRISPWGATRFRYLLRIARAYFDRSAAVA